MEKASKMDLELLLRKIEEKTRKERGLFSFFLISVDHTSFTGVED